MQKSTVQFLSITNAHSPITPLNLSHLASRSQVKVDWLLWHPWRLPHTHNCIRFSFASWEKRHWVNGYIHYTHKCSFFGYTYWIIILFSFPILTNLLFSFSFFFSLLSLALNCFSGIGVPASFYESFHFSLELWDGLFLLPWGINLFFFCFTVHASFLVEAFQVWISDGV